MSNITPNDLKTWATILVFIVGTAFTIDARYELRGAAEQARIDAQRFADIAELEANIHSTALEIARITGTQLLYQAKEEAGIITDGERARHRALLREKSGREAELLRLQTERAEL